MEKLHPRTVWLFFIRNFFVFLFTIVFFSFFISIFLLVLLETWWDTIGEFPFSFYVIIFLLLNVVLPYVWSLLTYKNWRYQLGEKALNIERGVIRKQYISIPYERIQNIDIYRGVLARLMGLSDLQVQTAGYSVSLQRQGMIGRASEGRLPGLEFTTAENLRGELIGKIGGGSC